MTGLRQHHAWFVFPIWGHITSSLSLIIEMLRLNPALVVTYVTHRSVDFTRYPDRPRDRFRIVTCGNADILKSPRDQKNPVTEIVSQLSQCWIETLQELCDDSRRAWPKPTALMLDHAGPLPTLSTAKQIVGLECKAFMYWPGSAARLYSFLAPSNKGGFSDWEATVDKYYLDETLRNGRDRDAIVEAVCAAKNGSDRLTGKIISIPGLKDMYDYEREFGEVPIRAAVSGVLQETTNLAKSTDAIVCASAVALEGETLDACKEYAAVYPVGVQIPPRAWLRNKRPVIHDEKLRVFLDDQTNGSVILITFGSIVFPTNLGALWTLTSTLEKTEHPFILVLGGMFVSKGAYATELAQIRDGGFGFVCEAWADQLAILQHPAVGWLLAHGGFNSAVESLVQGIPLVGWPLAPGDNAINVAMLSTRHRPVALELMQIRTGSAKAKPKRGGPEITGTDESIRHEIEDILSRMRGKEGSILKANAELLASELRCERDGAAAEAITRLASV